VAVHVVPTVSMRPRACVARLDPLPDHQSISVARKLVTASNGYWPPLTSVTAGTRFTGVCSSRAHACRLLIQA